MKFPEEFVETHANRSARRQKTTKSAKPKNGLYRSVSKFLSKAFNLFKQIAALAYEAIIHLFKGIVLLFNLFVRILTDPTSPSVVAITIFVIICAIAVIQWYSIGVWLGRVFGFSANLDFSPLSITSGFFGVLIGVATNIYQLSPILWKIRLPIAEALVALGVVTASEEDLEENFSNVQERAENWLSAAFGDVKTGRLISYVVETTLVVTYIWFTGFNTAAIVQAIISLVLPEKCLQHVASTVNVMSATSKYVEDNTDENDRWNQYF